MPDYQYAEISGVVESVTRGVNQNNRPYATVVVSGVDYSAWEPFVMQQAEMMQQAGCAIRGKARSKIMPNGSAGKFWTITELEADNGDSVASVKPASTAPARSQATSAPAAGIDDQRDRYRLRLELVKLAAAVLAGEEAKSPDAVILYAKALEQHVMGTSSDETK